jgi:hypothetical protein
MRKRNPEAHFNMAVVSADDNAADSDSEGE